MRRTVPASYARPHNDDHGARDLLDELITTPPDVEPPPLPAVALRSDDEQRAIALKPFLLRTWLDRALQQVEWLLVLATIVFFSYWVIDGYGRDWLREQQATAQAPVAAAPPVAVAAPTAAPAGGQGTHLPLAESDMLPFTTPAMQAAPATDDFLVPGEGVASAPLGDPRPNRMRIPALNLDTPVIEVTVVDGVWQVADYAAGYHRGSAYPGDVGNSVLAGHAGLRGAVFRDLGKLKPGDDIVVETAGWQYGYRVRELQQVLPHQVEVMAPTPTAVLTLITCTAWDTQRLIVVADLVDARPIGPG